MSALNMHCSHEATAAIVVLSQKQAVSVQACSPADSSSAQSIPCGDDGTYGKGVLDRVTRRRTLRK